MDHEGYLVIHPSMMDPTASTTHTNHLPRHITHQVVTKISNKFELVTTHICGDWLYFSFSHSQKIND